MSYRNTLALAFLLSCPIAALAQPANRPGAAVVLFDDDSAGFIRLLQNDGGLDATKIRLEFRDVYAGVSSIHVTPIQRFASRIPNWNYPIAEKPQPGQYRYLRFAWKRLDGQGIMIQLYANGNWNHRYFAGVRSNQNATYGPALQIDSKAPREWTVVTCDLFKDFGPMTLTGLALTPMEGSGGGLFDHFYLARTVEELDLATDAAFGKTPLKVPLMDAQLDALWANLASTDVAVASRSVPTLLSGRKESLPYLAKMLHVKPADGDAAQITRWIGELDDDDFLVRETAQRALDKLGDPAIRRLQQARLKATSQEQRGRLDALLKNRGVTEGTLTNAQLRLIRAVRVLEWSGTKEALAILDRLVSEPPNASLLPDIRQAQARLAKTLKSKSN